MNCHLYALKCLDLLVDLFGPLNSDNWLLTTCLDNLYLRPGEKKEKRQGQSWFFSHFYNIFIWHKNEITKVFSLGIFIDPKIPNKRGFFKLRQKFDCFPVGWCFTNIHHNSIFLWLLTSTVNPKWYGGPIPWISNLGMGNVAQQVHIWTFI